MPLTPARLFLGTAAGAAVTTACFAYSSSNPQSSLGHLLTSLTRYSARVDWSGRNDGAEFAFGNNNETQQGENGMDTREAETHSMIWALFQIGTLIFVGVYSYYRHGEEEKIAKLDVNSSSQTKSTMAPPASNASAAASEKCPVRENARQQGLVLYDGQWYSVGKFVPYHPGGGEVLNQYLGSDISFVFRVMHRNPDRIMKRRKPVRAATKEEVKALTLRREEVCHEMMEEYRATALLSSASNVRTSASNVSTEKFDLKAFEKDTQDLHQQFVNKGYFKPTLFWLVHKTALLILLLSLSILSMKLLPTAESTTSTPMSYILPGIFLGLFWHQSGFLMHDAEHHNLVGNECINDILGWIYGTVFLGVSGAWWREEHKEHHALLNTFDEDGLKDPQMREDVWIQHKSLIPFYGQEMIHFLTNFQHILFIPIIFLFGRIGILIDPTLTERKFRPWTIFGNILHLLLHYMILSQTSYPFQVYMIGSFQQAILSLQLLGNHYTKAYNPVHFATEANYFLW
eukprot:CAMPEP_0183732158 /NCGR_PEP_ID=MMETSP0737-20130205/37655_1 /TAXON_ID=385413 /ORGANISM="Thalassiosira miniscula, Strain CCMP1093" /LENGTH=514 /DNA_ID=CAMNT_0025965087 /DNA_START=206 /DNA_END=1747 /DNA_ORIENTATION=-